jgi:two-component system phosphate regulon sensor histidine kinase PhoR
MQRSGVFWQFFLLAGGLFTVAVVVQSVVFLAVLPRDPDAMPSDTWTATQQQIVWLTVLIGIAGLALAFWWTRRIVSPLQELAVEVEQIAAGDYGRKVFTGRQDELGVLARSFNHTSERLAAQFAQLDEDRQQLRAVLSSMAEGVVAMDAGQGILFANERAAQLMEFDSRSAVGRRLWEMTRNRAVQDVIESALSAGQGRDQELDWPGSAAKSLHVYAAPLPGTPPRGAVLVLHDTTELRRLERIRQEFVANVSHELKTPLAIIKANVETLLDGAIDDLEHRDTFLQRIAEQSDHLNALIIDLISLARIEAGTETYVFQNVAVADMVAACMERRRPLAEAKHQTLEMAPPQHPLHAWADEEAMLQILDNLVDNAIKYTPEHGKIQVRWWAETDCMLIEVHDNGVGIPRQELPRVFERFYRVDKARSRELGGTGLGLSIVKHLIQAMQGSIRADSEIGKGSTFTVRLPRSAS